MFMLGSGCISLQCTEAVLIVLYLDNSSAIQIVFQIRFCLQADHDRQSSKIDMHELVALPCSWYTA